MSNALDATSGDTNIAGDAVTLAPLPDTPPDAPANTGAGRGIADPRAHSVPSNDLSDVETEGTTENGATDDGADATTPAPEKKSRKASTRPSPNSEEKQAAKPRQKTERVQTSGGSTALGPTALGVEVRPGPPGGGDLGSPVDVDVERAVGQELFGCGTTTIPLRAECLKTWCEPRTRLSLA